MAGRILTAARTKTQAQPGGGMNKAQKIWGIVAAAGVGARMAGDRPKQYLPLRRRRVLDYALLALCESAVVDGVIAGIRDGDRWWRAQPFAHPKLLAVSRGGDSRARTVLNALRQLLGAHAAADDWVMVHDAARPCVSARDIKRLAAAARAHGHGAVLALPLADTLKRVGGGGRIEHTLGSAGSAGSAGEAYWRAVTPQMFRCGPLERALRECLTRGMVPSDESAAMEHRGVHAVAVAGHPANIKITLAADLELAAQYLAGQRQGG